MAQVELSLSDENEPESGERVSSSVRRWAEVVAGAAEPCVVLDADGVIVSISPSALELLGGDKAAAATTSPTMPGGHQTAGPDSRGDWIGRGLLDVLHLVDLTSDGVPLAAWETERVPPLLALSGGGLARAVMRIRLGDETRTVDAVSTPLRVGTAVAGSLTFLCLM